MNITQQLWSAKEWARVKATGNDMVVLVHEATNEEKWGPTGQQMEEICRAFPRGATSIMEELRWRLKNRDKSWRACYKSLLVLDYLVRNCGDPYLPELCSVVPTLRTIAQSFYYTNPKGIDHGVSVRERAKNLADLMSDGLLLREERQKAAQTKAKLARNSCDGGGPRGYGNDSRYGGYSGSSYPREYCHGARSGATRSPPYDVYRGPSVNPTVPRTKEEQERYDMEMALCMQRDEERATGVSVSELEAMYARQAKKAEPERYNRSAASADEELARRLQAEEETRARREGRELPMLRSDSVPPPSAPAPAKTEAVAPAVPSVPTPQQTNFLDDLFSLAPVSAPLAGSSAQPTTVDPFDTFLDNRAQQQQQWNQPQQQRPSAPSAMGSGQWSQAPQQPQQQQWNQPQQQWAQPQQPQQQQPSADAWAQPQQAQQQWSQPQQQQQWNQPPPQQQPNANSDPWAQPQTNAWPQQSLPQQQGSQWGQAPTTTPDPFTMPQQPQANAQAGTTDGMWGSLDRFSMQQQRR